ncbi:hypothetical protein PVAP13_5KG040300 [Panicum virgatum]|uniref:Uncharacterized protein n=1 Tax=Panicum virgatum TaxID=38727 RepID=A0A8T0SCZ0_PANVG|nr:hypothetical protein PVAP13_5KG040300 [Panicum virgatum]
MDGAGINGRRSRAAGCFSSSSQSLQIDWIPGGLHTDVLLNNESYSINICATILSDDSRSCGMLGRDSAEAAACLSLTA